MVIDFSWIPSYSAVLLTGLKQTVLLFLYSGVLGFLLAIPLAFAQMSKSKLISYPAKGFCSVFRGTPLLIQLWFIYYGIGSILPLIPGIRHSFLWPFFREGFNFAVISFALNFAAYEAETLRGALLSVPKGELEAARALGMRYTLMIRKVWLPRAFRIGLPTFAGEFVLLLKSTPLAFTITVMDLYGAVYKIRQGTFLIYEPLAVVAVVYVLLAIMVALAFKYIESRVPVRK